MVAVVRFFMGRRGIVLVSDPELVHEVTITAAERFRNRPMAMYAPIPKSGLALGSCFFTNTQRSCSSTAAGAALANLWGFCRPETTTGTHQNATFDGHEKTIVVAHVFSGSV